MGNQGFQGEGQRAQALSPPSSAISKQSTHVGNDDILLNRQKCLLIV